MPQLITGGYLVQPEFREVSPGKVCLFNYGHGELVVAKKAQLSPKIVFGAICGQRSKYIVRVNYVILYI